MTQNQTKSNFLSNFPANFFSSESLQQFTSPFLILIVSVFATSFTAIFLKLSLRELSVEATLFDRLLIGTIIFSSWNFGSQLWQSQTKEDINNIPTTEKTDDLPQQENKAIWITVGLMILLVITHTTGRLLYLWALEQTTAVNALTLSNLTPIFACLGAWLFTGRQFNRRFLIGLAIAIGGGIFLTLEDWLQVENQSFGTMAILGDGAALLCAMIYAFAILLTEKLLKFLSDLTFLTWKSFINLLFVAPLVLIQGDSIIPSTIVGWSAILGLGLICDVLARRLGTYSFKYFSATFLSIVFLLEPFPVAFFAWIILGEFLSLFNIMGFVLISLGIYLAKTGKGSEVVTS